MRGQTARRIRKLAAIVTSGLVAAGQLPRQGLFQRMRTTLTKTKKGHQAEQQQKLNIINVGFVRVYRELKREYRAGRLDLRAMEVVYGGMAERPNAPGLKPDSALVASAGSNPAPSAVA